MRCALASRLVGCMTTRRSFARECGSIVLKDAYEGMYVAVGQSVVGVKALHGVRFSVTTGEGLSACSTWQLEAVAGHSAPPCIPSLCTASTVRNHHCIPRLLYSIITASPTASTLAMPCRSAAAVPQDRQTQHGAMDGIVIHTPPPTLAPNSLV